MIFYILFREILIATGNSMFYKEDKDFRITRNLPKDINIYDSFSHITFTSPHKDRFCFTTSLWKIQITNKKPFIKFEKIYQPDKTVIRKIQSHIQATN